MDRIKERREKQKKFSSFTHKDWNGGDVSTPPSAPSSSSTWSVGDLEDFFNNLRSLSDLNSLFHVFFFRNDLKQPFQEKMGWERGALLLCAIRLSILTWTCFQPGPTDLEGGKESSHVTHTRWTSTTPTRSLQGEGTKSFFNDGLQSRFFYNYVHLRSVKRFQLNNI